MAPSAMDQAGLAGLCLVEWRRRWSVIHAPRALNKLWMDSISAARAGDQYRGVSARAMAAGKPARFPNHDRAKKKEAKTMRVKARAEAMRVGSSGGRSGEEKEELDGELSHWCRVGGVRIGWGYG